jgi:hypothetical protein
MDSMIKSLLHIVLDDLLISDIINIVYEYTKFNIVFDSEYNYKQFKYIAEPWTSIDCANNKIYVCTRSMSIINSYKYNDDNTFNAIQYTHTLEISDEFKSIDIYNDMMCLCGKQQSVNNDWNKPNPIFFNNIYVLDKKDMSIIKILKVIEDPIHCLFLTENIIITLSQRVNSSIIRLYDDKFTDTNEGVFTTKFTHEHKFNQDILSIGVNRNYIFAFTRTYNGVDIFNILIYDHNMNCVDEIKLEAIKHIKPSEINMFMRVYDDRIYISNGRATMIYNIAEL